MLDLQAPSMTYGNLTLLTFFPVNGSYYIGIYNGQLSPYDVLIKYRQREGNRWSRLRTPKHIHWAVDILIKQYQENDATNKLLDFLLATWDEISPWRSEEERALFIDQNNLISSVNEEAANYPELAGKGEYSIKFLILLAKLLMAQEKTNRPDAYMFKQLLKQLKDHKNIFQVISTATFH